MKENDLKKSKSRARAHQQLRAFDDEFRVIKEFMMLVRKIGVGKAEMALAVMKSEFGVSAS